MKLWFVYHYKKVQALVPEGDASNERLDVEIREHTPAQLEQCYEIITSVSYSLKKVRLLQKELGSPVSPAA